MILLLGNDFVARLKLHTMENETSTVEIIRNQGDNAEVTKHLISRLCEHLEYPYPCFQAFMTSVSILDAELLKESADSQKSRPLEMIRKKIKLNLKMMNKDKYEFRQIMLESEYAKKNHQEFSDAYLNMATVQARFELLFDEKYNKQ